MDVAYYDEKLLSVLLVEDTDDQTPVLLQLSLPVVDIGPLVEKTQCRWLDNMRAQSFAVSGTRHTATVLFSSKRRVRIFLVDAEEEDEEEDEDDDIDGADISNQSEADQSGTTAHDLSQSGTSSQENNQSITSTQIDSGAEGGEEGQEDKENTSLIRSGDQSSS